MLYPHQANAFMHLKKKIQKFILKIDSVQPYPKSQKTNFETLNLKGLKTHFWSIVLKVHLL